MRGLPRGYVCQRLSTQGVSAICQGHLPLDRDPPLDRDLPEQRSPTSNKGESEGSVVHACGQIDRCELKHYLAQNFVC